MIKLEGVVINTFKIEAGKNKKEKSTRLLTRFSS
jgi:hypothetical protein